MPPEWAHFVSRSLTTGFSGSAAALGAIKEWVGECVNTHTACGDDSERVLPTRLLDVRSHGRDDHVRIVETDGGQGRYAALSHCWGQIQPLQTTIDTLQARKSSIPLSDMSLTFQQAVAVTRALGLQYLWCDSLCIVQDDELDWAKEAARMATVYQNALVTIAATASESGDQGLFRRSHEVEVPGNAKELGPYNFIFRKDVWLHVGPTLEWSSALCKRLFPLVFRSWALQERLLSPRFLHFTPHEVVLECVETERCECRGVIKLTRYADVLKRFLRGGQHVVSHALMWKALITTYMQLRLSHPSDKLVAIAGLARRFQQPDNPYFAGLWSKSLLEDIQWVSRGVRQPRPVWRAPSWSWASVAGTVGFYSNLWVLPGILDREPPGYEFLTKVLSVETTPKSVDEYGELKSGKIRLRGRYSSVTWIRELVASRYTGQPTMQDFVRFPNSTQLPFHMDFEVNEETFNVDATKHGIVCFLIGLQLRENVVTPKVRVSLVLRCIDASISVYERIGILLEPEYGHYNEEPFHLVDIDALYPPEERDIEIL